MENNQWIETDEGSIQPRPSPIKFFPSFLYIPFLGKNLLYGGGRPNQYWEHGQNEVNKDDFWTWDGEHWEHIELSPKPTIRMMHGGVYDSKRKRFVIFGGWTVQDDQAYYVEDMWALSLNKSSIDAKLWQMY